LTICLDIRFIDNAEALIGIFAPIGTAEIYLWVEHSSATVSALKLRLIFEKLYGFSAAGTIDLKNVIGLPKSLALAWTSEHIYIPVCLGQIVSVLFANHC